MEIKYTRHEPRYSYLPTLLRQWPPYQAHSQPLPSSPPSHTHNNIPTATMHRSLRTGATCVYPHTPGLRVRFR